MRQTQNADLQRSASFVPFHMAHHCRHQELVIIRLTLLLANLSAILSYWPRSGIQASDTLKVIPLKLFYYQTFFETWRD